MKTELINNTELLVTYNDTPEIRDKVFEKVLEFYKKTELFSGESINQCDEGFIQSPIYLSKIADDILKFEVDYKLFKG